MQKHDNFWTYCLINLNLLLFYLNNEYTNSRLYEIINKGSFGVVKRAFCYLNNLFM